MTEISNKRNLRQALRSRTGRSIVSFIFILAEIVFWLSFWLFPFTDGVEGFYKTRIILYIMQTTTFVGAGLQLVDALFFVYPLGMLIAFVGWVVKLRRGGLLALISYLGLLSTGFTGEIGFLVCMVMIAICALTVIAD